MSFYVAMTSTDSVCWQDGEQTINPVTGEIQPIQFQPDFVCEWDGVSFGYVKVFGSIPEFIPYAGWPQNELAVSDPAQYPPCL